MSEELTQNITVKKGDEVFLDNVSLILNKGEAMALLGDNVPLKRLFLKIIASQKKDVVLLIEDDTVLSDIILSNSDRYILRTSILFGTFDVTEYLEYKFSHLEMPRAQRLVIIKDRLTRFGLQEYADKKLKSLSSHQAVLLNIVAQSTSSKKIIIIDGDSFLDGEIKPVLERAITGLKSLGYGIILSVCLNELADSAGIDRMGKIEDGKIKELTLPIKKSDKKLIHPGLISKWRLFLMKLKRSAKKAKQKKFSVEVVRPKDDF
jgi:ABC-type multidrug transport system ATPase subunit